MFMSSFNFIFKTTEKHKAPINFFPGDRLPHRPRDFQSGTKALYCTVDLQDHHEQSFYCHISTFGDLFTRIWVLPSFCNLQWQKILLTPRKVKKRTRDLDHNYLFWSDPTKGSQDQLSKSSRKTSNVFQSRPHFSHGRPYPITFLTHPRISSPKLPTKIVMTDL